ncbi:MAG: response regulator transcription factor [Acidobacteria bacterium]|nr:response regulator transcription factor [Acidobacteriota bacterium]
MSRPRVLIAEDHELLAEAFQKLLEAEVEVVGKVLDGRALLAEAPRLKPDIVILDISMPKLNGLEAGEQLKKIMPDVKLILLTIHEDHDLAVEAFRLVASVYLLKGSAASELFQAVQEVSRGRTYVTPLIAEGMIESFAQHPEGRKVSKLTPRQREILQLLAEGNSMKEVAAILNIAPRTVAFHKYRMMEMLGLKSNAELLRLAIKEQIVG